MRRFKASDLESVNEWLAARKLPQISCDDVGAIGFIVEGVGAGFLLRTDAKKIAMLDSFVTNPKAPLRARHKAVSALIERICREAKERGISRVCGFTASRGMTWACERLGFQPKEMLLALRKEL